MHDLTLAESGGAPPSGQPESARESRKREARGTTAPRARRALRSVAVAFAALSAVFIVGAQPARALDPGIIAPVSVATVTEGGAVVACEATVVCGVLGLGATALCIVACGAVVGWAHDRIFGTGTGAGAAGIGPPPTGALNPAPTSPPHGDDLNAFVLHVNAGMYGGSPIAYRIWLDSTTCEAPDGTEYPGKSALWYDYSGTPVTGGDYGFGGTDTVKPHSPLCGHPDGTGGHDLVVAANWKLENIDDHNESSYVTWDDHSTANDPATYTATVVCTNAAGAEQTLSSTGSATSLTPPDCQQLGSGWWRKSFTVTRPSSHGTQTIVASTVDLTGYPQCQPTGSSYPCTLTLTSTSTGGQTCKWGPYTMPASDCSGMTPQPDPSASPSTSPSPSPWHPPVVTGAPGASTSYHDATGALVQVETWTLTNGDTLKRTVTTATDGTVTTADVETSPDGTQVGSQEVKSCTPGSACGPPNDGDGRQCWPNGWGMFNPAEWVYRPIYCAFVPHLDVLQADVNGIGAAFDASLFGALAAPIGDVFAPITGLASSTKGDCAGPQIDFPVPFVTDPMSFHPLSACNPDVQAALGLWMPISTAFVYLGGLFGAYRMVGKAVLNTSPLGGD